jgi:hypothetical protein
MVRMLKISARRGGGSIYQKESRVIQILFLKYFLKIINKSYNNQCKKNLLTLRFNLM